MTASASIDTAVAELKLTTVSYPTWLKTVYADRTKTHWAKALAALDAAKAQIGWGDDWGAG